VSANDHARVDGYDEFRLRLYGPDGGPYHVHASTGSAEASADFELPFSDAEIENFMRVRRMDNSALSEAQRFGGALFKALFRDQIHALYHEARSSARIGGRGVRITLCLSEAAELIDVPWEYLYDEPNFLALSESTPVVRYLDLPRAHRPVLVEPPLRVLAVISSPKDLVKLDVDRERENLEDALTSLSTEGSVELTWLDRPTLSALNTALGSKTFHAVHYIGHGTFDSAVHRGALQFEDAEGWSKDVSGDELGHILNEFRSLRLAVLNMCEGARTSRTDPFVGVAGSLVHREIPAVVAMRSEISDEAAIVFASTFYRQLAAGSPVDASIAAARLAMFAEHTDDIEWGTPVLFMRVSDGRLFDLSGSPPSRRALAPSNASPGAAVTLADGPHHTRVPRIFINYRRDDTAGHARHLGEQLGRHFGSENVHLADNQASELDWLAGAEEVEAFLVLIGSAWAASLRAGTATPHVMDVARREVEWALRDAPDSVIPVVIDATMPEAEKLPRSLEGLCRKKSTELRDASFEQDLVSLIARLEEGPASTNGSSEQSPGTTASAADDGRTTGRPKKPRVASGIPEPYDDHFADVIDGMLEGSVVPLLGPRVREQPSISEHVTASLADQLDTSSFGFASRAQQIAVTLGERRLYNSIKREAQAAPTDVHHFLARLPGRLRRMGIPARHQLIISANYDSSLERAFDEANEPYDCAVYVAASGRFVHDPWGEHESTRVKRPIGDPRTYVGFPIDDDGQLERTIIVKIHGGADGREGSATLHNNYVVTEDQYIDYLPTHNIQEHLPIQILDKLTGSRCLFLGYPLRDWNARVFLRRIWRGKPISESSWAIEDEPDNLEKASWSMVGHVELLATDLSAYVNSLASALGDRGAGSGRGDRL